MSLASRMSNAIAKSPPVRVSKSIVFTLLGLFDKPLEKIIWNFVLIAVFCGLYMIFSEIRDSEGNIRKLTFNEAIYYTFATHFTVGYGDFYPINKAGRAVFMAHVALVWIVNMVPAGFLDDGDDVENKYAVGNKVMDSSTIDEAGNSSNRLNQALESNISSLRRRRSQL